MERGQRFANTQSFDFVQLGAGDGVGCDAEFAGGQLAVLVGVDDM